MTWEREVRRASHSLESKVSRVQMYSTDSKYRPRVWSFCLRELRGFIYTLNGFMLRHCQSQLTFSGFMYTNTIINFIELSYSIYLLPVQGLDDGNSLLRNCYREDSMRQYPCKMRQKAFVTSQQSFRRNRLC